MNDKATALIIRDERAEQSSRMPVVLESTPGNMLMTAIQRGMDAATIKDLMALSREHEAHQARKAYNIAFAQFKAEAVRIVKNTLVTDGPLRGKKYADLFDIVGNVTEFLAKHGLAHSWKLTKDEKDWMEVTCILRHEAGHCETDTQGGAPDVGPGRNAIQARRSTRTYLEKSTFTGVTGLAAANSDDDGNGGQKEEPAYLSGQELEDFDERVKRSIANVPKFLAFLKIESLDKLPLDQFSRANNAVVEREKFLAAKAAKKEGIQ